MARSRLTKGLVLVRHRSKNAVVENGLPVDAMRCRISIRRQFHHRVRVWLVRLAPIIVRGTYASKSYFNTSFVDGTDR